MFYDYQLSLVEWFNGFGFYDDLFGEYIIEILTFIPAIVLVFLALLPLRWVINFVTGGLEL